jgi:hypothetical protein
MNTKTRFFAQVLLASGLVVAAACGGGEGTKVSGVESETPEHPVQATEAGSSGPEATYPPHGLAPLDHWAEDDPEPRPIVPNADEGPLQHRLDR